MKDLVCNCDVDDASSILFHVLDILPDCEQPPLSLKQRGPILQIIPPPHSHVVK